MLVLFRVDNYRSFGTERCLDMRATDDRTLGYHVTEVDDLRMLPVAMVFGANSSGKTNLVRAMGDSRRMVVQGTPIPSDRVCRTLEGSGDRNIAFEYTILIGGRTHAYGFEVEPSTGKTAHEWLYVRGPEGPVKVFEHLDGRTTTDLDLSEEDRRMLDVCTGEVRTHGGLLLRAIHRCAMRKEAFGTVGDVMDWFDRRLAILGSGTPPTHFPGRGFPVGMLGAFGTGITGMDEEGRFLHGDAVFAPEEEPESVTELLALSPLLDPDGPEDVTYVVDGLGSGLHPLLTREFVGWFVATAARRCVQMVATTHESRLFDTRCLRPDEIWIINRRFDGTSDLYSLADFNNLPYDGVDGWYLDGRFKGAPVFSRSELEELLRKDGNDGNE